MSLDGKGNEHRVSQWPLRKMCSLLCTFDLHTILTYVRVHCTVKISLIHTSFKNFIITNISSKMKIKTISRTEEDYVRKSTNDIVKVIISILLMAFLML